MPLKRGTIKDKTGKIPTTFCGTELINKVTEKSCYRLDHLLVTKFQNQRLVKPTERTKIQKVESHEIEPPNDEDEVEQKSVVTCIVTKVDLDSFNVICKCPSCSAPVSDNEGFVECSCGTMTTIDRCQSTSMVSSQIAENGNSVNVRSPRDLV